MNDNWKKGDILYNFTGNENPKYYLFIKFLKIIPDEKSISISKPQQYVFHGSQINKDTDQLFYIDTYIKIGNMGKLLYDFR